MSQDKLGSMRGQLMRAFNRAAGGGEGPPPPNLAAARGGNGSDRPPPIRPQFQKAVQIAKEAAAARQGGSRDKPAPKLDREPSIQQKKAGALYDRSAAPAPQPRLRSPGLGR